MLQNKIKEQFGIFSVAVFTVGPFCVVSDMQHYLAYVVNYSSSISKWKSFILFRNVRALKWCLYFDLIQMQRFTTLR